MHLPCRCSALSPDPGPLARPHARLCSNPCLQASPCALSVPHLVPCGTAWHHKAPKVLGRRVGAPPGAFKKIEKEEARLKKNFAESTITFLIFRTAPRGFCCVLAMPWRTQFSTLEGVLPSEVLASIGLIMSQESGSPGTQGAHR